MVGLFHQFLVALVQEMVQFCPVGAGLLLACFLVFTLPMKHDET